MTPAAKMHSQSAIRSLVHAAGPPLCPPPPADRPAHLAQPPNRRVSGGGSDRPASAAVLTLAATREHVSPAAVTPVVGLSVVYVGFFTTALTLSSWCWLAQRARGQADVAVVRLPYRAPRAKLDRGTVHGHRSRSTKGRQLTVLQLPGQRVDSQLQPRRPCRLVVKRWPAPRQPSSCGEKSRPSVSTLSETPARP